MRYFRNLLLITFATPSRLRSQTRNTSTRGSGTVENLMMTAVIAGILIPIVYQKVIMPFMNTMNGQRQKLVDFVAQNDRKTVPSAWFAAERMAQIKNPTPIEEPKEISEPKSIAQPGEIRSQEIGATKEIASRTIPPPKEIAAPKPISAPRSGGQGGGGGNGAGTALGSDASDPSFFKGNSEKSSSDSNSKDGSDDKKRSAPDSNFDEYAPNPEKRDQTTASRDKTQQDKKRSDSSIEKKERANLVLNEVRAEESARSKAFDWWLLIKLLILALIIFLIVLIGLGNMRKR